MRKISKRNWFRIIWFSLVLIFSLWQWSTYQSAGIETRLWGADGTIEVIEDESKISFIYSKSSRIEVI